MINKSLLTAERLAFVREKRAEMRAEGYAKWVKTVGKDIADELKKTYDLFDETLYIWLAGLWEPSVGGFYYSETARDYDGFLPDIESTAQALGYMQGVGLCQSRGATYSGAVSPEMRSSLLKFAKGLQYEDDGFFYHPQWGKDIVTSRRGRDLSWAVGVIKELGDTPTYPTPMDRAKSGADSSTLPEYLRSTDAWREYLATLDIAHRSYSLGNLLQSQTIQIKGAGDEYVDILLDWLESTQNPENGTWEKEVNYASVNGLMKITLLYSAYRKKLPNADKAAESAIAATLSDEVPTGVTSVFNPWVCISNLIENLKNNGYSDKADALYSTLLSRGAEMIRITREKLLPYKAADGAYSYSRGKNAYLSQNAYVAIKDTDEAEVNGNGLATNGTVREIFRALRLERTPYFCAEDSELFLELLDTATPSPKLYPAVPNPAKKA